MGGGSGSGTTTQVQKADPWVGAQPFLMDAYQQAQNANRSTSTGAFQGDFVNPANAAQWGALVATRDAANGLADGSGVASVADRSLSGEMLTSNPYLQDAIEATIRPTVQGARDVIMPSMATAAGEGGAFGGTRQAFLESLALRDVDRQVADTAAQMWNENYGRERAIQTQVAPQMLQLANQLDMARPQALMDVGNQQYALDDLARQNQVLKFEDEVNRHWRAVNPYIAALSGIGMPGGTTTSQASAPRASPTAGAAGGAAAGAAAGVPLAGATYGLSIPIGALIGGTAGYFGSR